MSIKFSIDGVRVEAEEGDSLLDTARRYGFEIPSLCHHEAIVPYGACRLCLVEITKGGRKKITTSCNYEVLNDIAVATDSPEIRKHRAMVLELILAEAPENEHIKKLALEYGVKKSRFRSLSETEKDREECILCGLCARVCSQIVEVNALTFKGRGYRRSIAPAFLEEPKTCIACGACAWVCPTQCIGFVEENGMRKVVRWGRELPLEKDQNGRPFAPKFQLFQFSQAVGLPKDFYKKAPGDR
jgi:NADH dehydrogenase/NADH:ubiquinone oxidoreductase subunit G